MSKPVVPEPVHSFFERVNAHDEEAFLAAFADNAVVDDWGRVFEGRDAIKGWSDREFIGSKGVLSVEEVHLSDSGITVIGDWRSSYANGRSSFTFELDGSLFARMTIREG